MKYIPLLLIAGCGVAAANEPVVSADECAGHAAVLVALVLDDAPPPKPEPVKPDVGSPGKPQVQSAPCRCNGPPCQCGPGCKCKVPRTYEDASIKRPPPLVPDYHPKARRKFIRLSTNTVSCGPCIGWDRNVRPKLESTGWRIGTTADCHIQVIDNASGTVPRFELVEDGRVVRVSHGYMDEWAVGRFME